MVTFSPRKPAAQVSDEVFRPRATGIARPPAGKADRRAMTLSFIVSASEPLFHAETHSEILCRTVRTWSMQARRREGHRSFPLLPPSESACPTSDRPPPCAAVRSPSGALQLAKLVTAHAAMLLAPALADQF